jgi:hypothetical protein
VAVWTSNKGTDLVQAAVYDATRPDLRQVSVPPAGQVGVPVTLSVSPFDVWSGVSTSWTFGDGGGALGAATSHTYTAPGTYQVGVTAADAVGNQTRGTGQIQIAPAPLAVTGHDVAAHAAVTRLRISPARFRAARRGGSALAARAPSRAGVSYTLDAKATVTFSVQRVSAKRKGRTRVVNVRGSFARRSAAGINRFAFTGRVGGRRLAPGTYRLLATPATGAPRGRSVAVTFRILR